ncbi:hypothetical protein [Bartonella acomydis]|uniref:Uncharacterized protein n=1 Tax=Bartonella acomydis TaxID=686234 RepID=A0ABP9MJY5_9HYPH
MLRFALYFLFLFSFALHAQETDNHFSLSPLVANYPLTKEFLLKLETIAKECKNLPPETAKIENNPTIHNEHIEKYIAYISRKPGLVNILRENNLTPKDFVVGHLALQATLNVLTSKETSFHEQNTVSSSNIEFAKKHMYRIIKILRNSC